MDIKKNVYFTQKDINVENLFNARGKRDVSDVIIFFAWQKQVDMLGGENIFLKKKVFSSCIIFGCQFKLQ